MTDTQTAATTRNSARKPGDKGKASYSLPREQTEERCRYFAPSECCLDGAESGNVHETAVAQAVLQQSGHQLQESPSFDVPGRDATIVPPVQRLAAFLADDRFSHPANAVRKAQVVGAVQQGYGNYQVQRVMKCVQAKRGDKAYSAGIEFTAEEVREALGGPVKPKFKLEPGPNFKETLDGVSLDSTLLKRIKDMAQFATESGLVTADITLHSGMRSPGQAHVLSTAYHIGQGMVPLEKLQALPAGRDRDGNVWYKKEWETTRGGKKATPRQIMAKARANAKAKFPKQRQAAEGYRIGDPGREPNTFKGGVTLHATGRAIDATFWWDWTKGKKSQEKVMDPAKLNRIKDKAMKIRDEEKREKLLKTISEFEEHGSYSATAEETVAKFGLSRPILHSRTSPEDWHYELPGTKK